MLLEDFHLIEKLARFDRERIPERVVHARGTGAHGSFGASADFSGYTKASLFAVPGNETPVFVRFSTVIRPKGSPEAHRSADEQLEALAALGETALHAATAEQHGDAPFDAGPKALPFLDGGTLLGCFALAAALRDAHDGDADLLAPPHILLTEEATIRAVQFRGMAEGFLVAFQ